jgi:hypothetical protein
MLLANVASCFLAIAVLGRFGSHAAEESAAFAIWGGTSCVSGDRQHFQHMSKHQSIVSFSLHLIQRLTLVLRQAGAAALLTTGSISGAAIANEFDVLTEPTPTSNYVIDDAGALNKTTRKGLNEELASLEVQTGQIDRIS